MRVFLIALSMVLVFGCGDSGAEPVNANASATSETNTDSWNIDKSKSTLGFSAVQNGNRFDGEFTDYTAQIVFDPDMLSKASISVLVGMDSAVTEDRQRDNALPGSDWFKTKDFPTAEFKSTQVRSVDERRYEAYGTLTIRDVAKDIVLPFTVDIAGDVATAKGAVTLLRADFGVGQGEFSTDEWVGLEVEVEIDITATR